MSQKKKRQLIALLSLLAAAAALLVGVTLGTRWMSAKAEQAEADAAIYVDLPDDPTTLAWSSGESSLSFAAAEDGTWHWTEDADFPLSSSSIQSVLTALTGLTAVQEFAPADSLDAYGLTESAYTLTVSDAQGSETRLLIGSSFTEDGEQRYYAMYANGDTILVLDNALPAALTDSMYDMADLNVISSPLETQVTRIEIQGAVDTLLLQQATEDEEGTLTAAWSLDGADVTQADQTGRLTGELLSLSFTALADWKPDEAALEGYGLTAPVTVTIDYTDTDANPCTQQLLVGGLSSDGSSYYATCDGGTSVYLLSASAVDDLMSVAAAGLDTTVSE